MKLISVSISWSVIIVYKRLMEQTLCVKLCYDYIFIQNITCENDADSMIDNEMNHSY